MIELILLIVIAIFALSYRFNNGENVYKFFVSKVSHIYDKYAPYSFKEVRQKTKELGQEYTAKQYATQVVIFMGVAGVISYLYFYNIIIAVIYASLAVLFIPYLAFLRCKKHIQNHSKELEIQEY